MAKRLEWMLIGLTLAGPVWGFDGAIAIDNPNFKQENFLDIQSVAPRPSQQRQWWDTENGIQVGGASTDSHRLAYFQELRLKHDLTPRVDMRMSLEEHNFYRIIPAQRPLFELAYEVPYLPLGLPVEFSVLGSPAYDKRQSDLGLALSIGLRPRNYLRLQWLRQDMYYNKKNVFDESRYERSPNLLQLAGDFRLDERLRLYIELNQSRPLLFLDPEQALSFYHRSNEGFVEVDYFLNRDSWLGMELGRAFVRKHLIDDSRDHGQRLRYDWLALLWAHTPNEGREWVIGARFDRFENELSDYDHAWLSQDYYFRTAQLYSTYYYSYAANRALEWGLYVGDAQEQRRLTAVDVLALDQQDIQSKLRLGWEFFATDQSNRLLVFLSLNLDDPINDPGDGGGMSYQLSF